MTPPGDEKFTRSGKLSTLRKLFTKRRGRPSLPTQYPQKKLENSAISNVPLTMSFVNHNPEQRNSAQIQRYAKVTLGAMESVLLVSEELEALTSHRQALDSLAAKFKNTLGKVQIRKATNDRVKDEQRFYHEIGPVTNDERQACEVTWKLISLLCKMVQFDVMADAERDRKENTRTLVQFLLKLGLDEGYRSSAIDAQKQLFEKVAKLCTQYVNECKPNAKDDVPNGVTPADATQDAAPPKDASKDDFLKDDAPRDDAPMDDAPMDDVEKVDAPKDDPPMNNVPDGDALDHDVLYHTTSKQVGEHILLVAGRFQLLEVNPQTTDAMGDTQKQILDEISKLCTDFLNFGNDGGEEEIKDADMAAKEIRGLARSINRRLGYILAKVEMKPVDQRQELILLVNLNLNRWMDECRKDVKRVEEKESTGSPQSWKEIGTQTQKELKGKARTV